MIKRSIAAIAVFSFAAIGLSEQAGAAVMVLGNGIPQSCYHAAEFGGNTADGIAVCTTALDETAMTTHDRAATFINRGILRSASDPTGALSDYNHGLELNEALGEGYVDRGAAEILLKDYDAALVDINKGIELNANRPEIAYYDRAVVNEALGNIQDAYSDYKKAVEIQPDFPLASNQLVRFRVVPKHTSGA